MSTVTTTTPRHVSGDRIVLLALLVLATIAYATGARVTWELPDLDTTAPAPATVAAATTEHAERVAAAAQELDALRQATRVVPAASVALDERIELLRLVTLGAVPVAAAEAAPAGPVAVGVVDPGRTAGVVGARQELAALRVATRTSPSVAAGLAEEMATLDAIGRGLVPPETILSNG